MRTVGSPRALAKVSEGSVRGVGGRSSPKNLFRLFFIAVSEFELTYLLATDFIFLFLVMIHNTLE